MSAVAHARQSQAPPFIDPRGYSRHRPERTLLYQLVEQHYPAFRELRAAADRPLPDFVQQEFEAYLKCGRLEEGFLRVRCEQCHAEKLVAFSCKKRGFCPSCGGRRMAETAALLADEVLPERPLRQWVLSLPHALRFLLATNSQALTPMRPCFIPCRLPSRATCSSWSSRSPDASAARWNVTVWLSATSRMRGSRRTQRLARWMTCLATRSPTASRWGRGPGRSSLRCRRLRLDCRDWKLSRTGCGDAAGVGG